MLHKFDINIKDFKTVNSLLFVVAWLKFAWKFRHLRLRLQNLNSLLFVIAWLTHTTLKLVKAVADLDVYIEQPCRTYSECLTVRAHTNLPFILVKIISIYNIK